ncbi:MAG: radical SAM/SPASM domain-containing protein [Vulcanimicrobiota bacterium]
MNAFLRKLKMLVFLIRTKGLRYTWHRFHYHIFWEMRIPFLTRLIYAVSPYPSYIEIEVSTRCNLRCIICEHTYWDEPARDMSLEQFTSIIDQFPLKWIGVTGIGESFMNKDFMDMLRLVKSRDIVVEMYDTFYFIDEVKAAELVELEIDRILISLDAATKETYEKIRVNSDFDRVVSNLRKLFEFKKKKNSYFPRMAFHYIINHLNIGELEAYLDLVASIVQGEKAYIQFTRMLHFFKEIEDLYTEVPEELIGKLKEKGEAMGITVEFGADVSQNKPPAQNCIEWTMPFIFVTGHVIPCCAGNEAGQRAFQKEQALGNIFEQPFKEIWNGKKYQALRTSLRKGKTLPVCRNCCVYKV